MYCETLVEGNTKSLIQVQAIKKAMLPNTNKVDVNFGPTDNLISEIKPEIHLSLSYYFEITSNFLMDSTQDMYSHIKCVEL